MGSWPGRTSANGRSGTQLDRRRLAYVELLPNERAESEIALRRAVASFAARAVNAEPADRQRLRLRRPPLWPCLPSARAPAQPHSASPSAHEWESRALHQDVLTEWAYTRLYVNSEERAQALPLWLNHYNYRRPRGSLGHQPPSSRLNNVSTSFQR